ncbi:MAG: hypothetical protein K9H06_20955 [Melioribacteraceae bacterium]|nr:hypothetical protein [Melioribacteraceae bacterium]
MKRSENEAENRTSQTKEKIRSKLRPCRQMTNIHKIRVNTMLGYHVYILKSMSSPEKHYVGYTEDYEKR